MSWAYMPRIVAATVLVLANLHNTESAGVTPVGKVIDLLAGLAKQVQDEGKREATTYEEFSCFCQKFTESKSLEITKGADTIDDLSTTIEEKSTEVKDKQKQVSERKAKQETLSKELDETKSRCRKEEHIYDTKVADFDKALGGISDALKSLANSKKAGAAVLLDLSSVHQSLGLAEAMDLVQAPVRQDVKAFLQQSAMVDPQDAEYKFHSGDIVSVLENIQAIYKMKREELNIEWKKTDAACQETETTLDKDLGNNKDAILKLEEKAEGLSKDISKAKEDLVSEQTSLQDAQAYLKDLTLRCEARAKDWDQRSSMRFEEVEALNKALKILEGSVKSADAAANKRALLLSARKPVVAKAHGPSSQDSQMPPRTVLTSVASDSSDGTEITTELAAIENGAADDEAKAPVDLPSGDSKDDVASWLHGGAPSFVQVKAVTAEARRKDHVLAFVQQESRRLSSSSLASLVMRANLDPFGKVKGLIQQLIERLLEESESEATKKGFCDEQLAKVKQERDYNMEEANKLNAEIRILKANKDSLDTEASDLDDQVADLKNEMAEAKKIRDQEHADNLKVLKEAKEGLEATNDAYILLQAFYNRAAPAVLLQASPVDEDLPGAPQGEYNGQQGAAQGILGLLQVIISDFERTLRNTEAEEKQGAADFEETKQKDLAAMKGHSTKSELNVADSKTTDATIKQKLKDIQFAMDVVDSNIKTLEELKPTCQESGRMSFKERTEKREDEMAALKKALDMLAP